ncbi:MAG: restriction endonuclease subunit S [Treponemataceae bacterium]
MSYLNELIARLCPDGVEQLKIKDCYKRLRGTSITAGKMKEIECNEGEIRVFAGGKTVINAKEEDIPNANITRVPAVLVQSRGVIDTIYFESPFTFKNEMWAYTHDEKVSVKYLYYVLKNSIQIFRDAASRMGSLPQISLTVTEDFIIPLPPLEIQQEIVRILDTFSELITELKAELTARKKQYEYYRDSLLTFGDDVEWKTLVEVLKIKNGKDYKQFGMGEIPVYGSGGVMTYIDTFTYDKPSVLIPRKGSIDKLYYIETPFWTVDTLFYTEIYTNLIIPKYVFYFLQKEHLENYNTAGGVPSLTQSVLNKIEIPVPPLAEQQRIVDILDRFDILCNDLSIGLPAEIEARQQQYEYYRDKLLTFQEKNNA